MKLRKKRFHLKSKKEIDIVTKSYNFIHHILSFSLVFTALACMKPNSKENDISLKTQINISSCIELIERDNLEKTLQICNKVIDKFPNNPQPYNDRSLIYTLSEEIELACQDTKTALDLIKKNGNYIDPLIKYQINIRYDSCRKRSNIFEKDIS